MRWLHEFWLLCLGLLLGLMADPALARQNIEHFKDQIVALTDETNAITPDAILDQAGWVPYREMKYQGGRNNWIKLSIPEPYRNKTFWIEAHPLFAFHLVQDGRVRVLREAMQDYYKLDACGDCSLLIRTNFSSKIYLRITFLADSEVFGYRDYRRAVHWFYVGSALSLAIYSLFSFFSMRRGYFLSAAAVNLSFVMLIEIWYRLWFVDDFVLFHFLFFHAILCCSYADLIVRAIGKENLPSQFRRSIYVTAACVFLVPFLHDRFPFIWFVLVGFLLTTCFACIWVCIKVRGHVIYLVLSWSAPLLANILLMLYMLEIIPYLPYQDQYLEASGLVDFLFLSFATGAAYKNERARILRQNITLAKREIDLNAQLRSINENLEQLVAAKTRDVRVLLENIEHGIVTIQGPDLRFGSKFTPYASNILEASSLDGLSFMDVFISRTNLDADTRSVVVNCLAASLGQKLISFELNRPNLPFEVEWQGSKVRKILELNWGPVFDETETIHEVILVFKDVSARKQSHLNFLHLKEEVDSLSSIAKIGRSPFYTSIGAIRESFKNVIDNASASPSTVATLRNLHLPGLHAMKGVARSMGLKEVASCIHEAESVLLEGSSVENIKKALQPLANQVFAHIHTLENLVESRFGWRHTELLLEFETPELRAMLAAITSHNERGKVFHYFLVTASRQRLSLQTLIMSLTPSMARMAETLQKPVPELQVSGDDIILTEKSLKGMQAILPLLLANAMDHGIEAPRVRLAKGKRSEGRIQILIKRQVASILISFSDDGGGLDLTGIRQAAQEKARIEVTSESTARDIAELIFVGSLTTKAEAGPLSGRGVGLSFLKHYIEQAGGRLQLVLDNPETSPTNNPAFRFDIEWPASDFILAG